MANWWVATLVVAVLAGCAATEAPPPVPREAAPSPAPAFDPAQTTPGLIAGVPLLAARATEVSGGSEPVVVTDRAGRFVWVGDTSGGYLSQNNGTTWARMGAYPGGANFLFQDGWDLTQDDAGNLYAAVLRDNRVDVVRSRDGGVSWDQVGYAAGVSGTADRPWIAAKGDGEVALFYFDAPTVLFGFFEHCARSTDGGQTFPDRDPVAVSPGTGGSLFYDAGGALYFASNSGSLMRFTSTCLAGGDALPMAGESGVNNMLQGAADGTDLYMVAATAQSAQITLYGSHGGGSVKKLVVSPPDLKSNTYATVSAHNGQLAVAWYGSTTAGDPSAASFAGEFHTYLAIVDGFWSGAPSIRQMQLTQVPNHDGQICMGGAGCDLEGSNQRGLLDYFKADHDIWGGIHVAYVDDTSGSPRVLHVRVPPTAATPTTVAQPPRADFSVRIDDRTAKVDASLSRSTTGTLTYAWDWGDGAKGTGVKAEHTYAEHGQYTIKLTVTDPVGRTHGHSIRVTVDGTSRGPPEAAWDVEPIEPMAGEAARFTDRSTSPGGAIASHAWDFGDGRTAEGETVEHTYEAAGTYLVRLTVQDAVGAEDSLERDVVVLAPDGTTPTSRPPTSTHAAPAGLALAVAGLALAVAVARRR